MNAGPTGSDRDSPIATFLASPVIEPSSSEEEWVNALLGDSTNLVAMMIPENCGAKPKSEVCLPCG